MSTSLFLSRPLSIRLLTIACLLFPSMAPAAEGWPRTIDAGHGAITLAQAPQRIVSTSVTLTGTLLAICAPVVASGATSPNNRVADNQGFFRQWGAVAKQRQLKRLSIGEVNVEAVAAEAPDLILVSATGGDSALRAVDQLSSIAPVLVIGYDDRSWQQLASDLGRATGHEADAQRVIDEYTARVATLKAALRLPPQPVSAFVYNPATRQANLWTPEAAQGQLLQQLGFTLASVPTNLAGGHAQGQRKDILQLGGETLADGLTGQSFLLFAAEDNDVDGLADNPLLAHLPAIQQHRVYALGADSFRLDPYSANAVLDRLQRQFVPSAPVSARLVAHPDAR